jgi:phosphatidylserine decarboxylase
MSRVYFDRAAGALREERVHAGGLLHWLYNSRTGALAERILCSTPHASRLYGWLQRRALSRRRIRPFVERLGVDLTESVQKIDEFASFRDFFTRRLHPWARPRHPDPEVCLAPVDGKVLVYPQVAAGTEMLVKGNRFDLSRLLGDAVSASFAGGAVAVCRLAMADYHHFHFPDGGTPGTPRRLAGAYRAGGSYARRRVVPFFENHRVVTPFRSDRFGSMALVEVGAFTVGSIRQRFEPGRRVARGEEKGYFEPGGSTVVLAFRPGAIVFDADLVSQSAEGVETFVRMGDSLGRAVTGDARER